ncbi:MAG: primosomal protein N' (replication factor Y) - superfamily II helicase [Cyanobacteria bacterium P01_C01_bin.70]
MTSSTTPSTGEASLCPGCGAGLVFNPKLGKLSCPYCDTSKTVMGGLGTVNENPLQQSLEQAAKSATTTRLSAKAQQVECNGCHALISFEPPEVAGDCPFCGTHITAQPKTADPVITPGGILPFKLDRKAGRQTLTKWLSTRWFAPSSLKQLAQHEALTGMYLPFWTFDAHTRTSYSGQRGDYYYVTKTRRVRNSDGEWETKTYKERRTRWTSVSGNVSCAFDDVLIPAVRSVNLQRLAQLGPWPLKHLVAYDPAFLQGFRAQRYQVSLASGHSKAKDEMGNRIYSAICSDIGGDEQRVHSRNTTYRNETFKHILLPVWMATYRFKNKPYQVMINGESGKIQGDRPYCPFKIGAAISAGLLSVAAIWAGYNYHQGYWQLPTWLTNPGTLLPIPTPSPAPNAPDSTELPSATPSSTTPATPTAPATPAPSAAFQAGLNVAYEAATKTQAAQSPAEWQEIINLWAEAIDTLKQVPPSDPNAAIAQQKIQDYQRNLNYAREQLQKAQ